MITERSSRDNEAPYLTDSACAYPTCTLTVGRVRLLYGILQASGMDENREIQSGW